MSNTTKSIEYGTRKSNVSIVLNVPYVLREIGTCYNKLVGIKTEQNIKACGRACVDAPELREMEDILNEMKRLANAIRTYLDRYDPEAAKKYNHSSYYKFYANDMDEFIISFAEMIEADKKALASA